MIKITKEKKSFKYFENKSSLNSKDDVDDHDFKYYEAFTFFKTNSEPNNIIAATSTKQEDEHIPNVLNKKSKIVPSVFTYSEVPLINS